MSSNSEVSYGARIGNAEKLVAALQNFNNYQAVKPEYGITQYTTFIAGIKTQNNEVAAKKQTYSLAVDNRQHIFDLNGNSIKNLLSPINGAVKAIFGKTAKESTDVAAIIAKIRGANGKKKSKSGNPDEETVSHSYQSFSSRTQFFADLIVNLTNFGTGYSPANSNVSLANLNLAYTNAIASNNDVMDSFTQFVQTNSVRMVSYAELSRKAQAIKESVKSQYGFSSTEYRLIKGLKI